MSKKNIAIFIAFFIPLSAMADQLSTNQWLRTGDSLFQQKKYREAFDIYQKIAEQGEAYTPSMLLKMAFVKDGLGEYPETLYYLNLLYQFDKNPAILEQISNIAGEHELRGYKLDDEQFVTDLLDTSKFTIAGAALSVMAILVIIGIIMNWGERKNIGMLFAAASVIAIFLAAFNFGYENPKAVIKERALLMSEPSPGARQLQQINKGHRVEVVGQEDIWYEIEWEGQKAYIRADNLLLL